MRKEPFTTESFVHVYNRGNRKEQIVHDEKDRWRFLQMLLFFNDEYAPLNLFREIKAMRPDDFYRTLVWPPSWPARKPLVKILAFSLLDNHFHLLLKEIRDGGITMFMRKLGTGMTNYYNIKYQQTGRLFQGAYKAKVVDSDLYLQYLSVYIQVRNPLELYPGGISQAVNEIENALKFALDYSYCSFADYGAGRNSSIIEKDILGEIFKTPNEYLRFARECLLGMNIEKTLSGYTFES